MDDREKRDALALEIRELKERLKPLEDECNILNSKIDAEHIASLPYIHEAGYFCQEKEELTALYWNYEKRTYYTKPMFKQDGTPYGRKSSMEEMKERLNWLKLNGFSETK